MPNKMSKAQQSKPKSKSKRTARVAYTGSLPKHPAVGSVTDCMTHCKMGSEETMRLQDDSVEESGATVLPDDYVLTSDAQGNVVMVERPDNGRTSFSVDVNGLLGAGANFTPTTRNTNFLTQTTKARLICMKVIVTYIGAELASAGYLTLVKKNNHNEFGLQNISSLHNDADIQVAAQEGATAYVNYRQPPRYENPATQGAAPLLDVGFMTGTFPLLGIVASGLPPSSAVLKIRVLRFVEFLPATGTIAQGSQMSEPANPAAMSVAGMLSKTVTSFHSNAKEGEFKHTVEQAANAAYHVVQPYAQYLVPAALAALRGL